MKVRTLSVRTGRTLVYDSLRAVPTPSGSMTAMGGEGDVRARRQISSWYVSVVAIGHPALIGLLQLCAYGEIHSRETIEPDGAITADLRECPRYACLDPWAVFR